MFLCQLVRKRIPRTAYSRYHREGDGDTASFSLRVRPHALSRESKAHTDGRQRLSVASNKTHDVIVHACFHFDSLAVRWRFKGRRTRDTSAVAAYLCINIVVARGDSQSRDTNTRP